MWDYFVDYRKFVQSMYFFFFIIEFKFDRVVCVKKLNKQRQAFFIKMTSYLYSIPNMHMHLQNDLCYMSMFT